MNRVLAKDRTNIVYELAVQASRENFERFHRMIGSSISRKHLALGLIVNSYCQDLSDVRRRAQRKGADAKRRKTIESILPGVVEGVRRLIQDGVKPTHRACRAIPGYNRIHRSVPQAELVAMAKK